MNYHLLFCVTQGPDTSGESGDGLGDLAAGLHPLGLWRARRVRLHPTASHSPQQEGQASEAGRLQRHLTRNHARVSRRQSPRPLIRGLFLLSCYVKQL